MVLNCFKSSSRSLFCFYGKFFKFSIGLPLLDGSRQGDPHYTIEIFGEVINLFDIILWGC